jgi:hypothetical protein
MQSSMTITYIFLILSIKFKINLWSKGSNIYKLKFKENYNKFLCLFACSCMHEKRLPIDIIIRDVNRFWGENWKVAGNADDTTVCHTSLLGALYGRRSGINGAKSCILGLSCRPGTKFHYWNFIFCTIFLIFSAIVQDKRAFFFLLLLIILWQWFRHFNLLTTKMY